MALIQPKGAEVGARAPEARQRHGTEPVNRLVNHDERRRCQRYRRLRSSRQPGANESTPSAKQSTVSE